MKPRILVIDDEAAIRDSMKMILEYEGYEVLTAPTGEDGIAQAEREAPDLVFLDVKMPAMDGLEVLQRLRHLVEVTPIVVVSGHGTVSTAVEATKLGAFDFIEKPLERERVLVTVRNAVDSRRLRTENRSFKRDAEKRYQIVGDSPLLGRVREAIAKAAPTSATVLIWGESGVGKELVARAIHRESLRRDGPFVQVNCAAIPDELIESELFGHEKGSFTGATDRQIGKFEQADKGTIFLDEIGDMSLKTQAKVLRVLQEQELERLGSNRIIKVDVRVIAATNKNLEEEIIRGTFREDLFYRLNVIPIHVPPLRERKDDLAGLVRHFADLFSRENNFRRKTFTQAAMERLKQHHWRGNIRELRNFVERLIIMSPGDQVDVKDLPDFTAGAYVRAPGAIGAAGAVWRRGVRGSVDGRDGLDARADAAGVQVDVRTGVSGQQAAGKRLEHLEDRRGHRHAAQQSLQEARAVPDLAGEGWLAAALAILSGRGFARGGRSPSASALPPGEPRELARPEPRVAASRARERPSRLSPVAMRQWIVAVGRMIAAVRNRCALFGASRSRALVKCARERKVRTPQGSVPGNTRAGQPDGKWHRKYTARRRSRREALASRRRVRVKRCGKSAPRFWQQGWQAKPRTEQDQIGRRSRTARPKPSGRLLDPVSDAGARGMIIF